MEIDLSLEDMATLESLAREYAQHSAHECLWDRLAAAAQEAVRREEERQAMYGLPR